MFIGVMNNVKRQLTQDKLDCIRNYMTQAGSTIVDRTAGAYSVLWDPVKKNNYRWPTGKDYGDASCELYDMTRVLVPLYYEEIDRGQYTLFDFKILLEISCLLPVVRAYNPCEPDTPSASADAPF